VAMAPEVPRHLEEREEATAAHTATSASAPFTPSTTSSLGTPMESHAIPPLLNPPHSFASHPPLSITSLAPMPSVATHSTPLSVNVGTFIRKKILTKNASGQEINLATLQRVLPAAVPPVPTSSTSVQENTKRPPIQIESLEQQENHHAEERTKEGDGEESKRSGVVAKANEDAAHCLIEKPLPDREAEEAPSSEEESGPHREGAQGSR
jgi:hypothetical protein